jgi:hypothetical protein
MRKHYGQSAADQGNSARNSADPRTAFRQFCARSKTAPGNFCDNWPNRKGIAMLDRIKKIIATWTDHAEIDAMSDLDLQELGVSRAQLHHLAAMPAHLGDRVAAMAAIFGVKAEDLQFPRPDFYQMLNNCEHCTAGKECAHMLAKRGADPAECGFCPNAEAFAALA